MQDLLDSKLCTLMNLSYYYKRLNARTCDRGVGVVVRQRIGCDDWMQVPCVIDAVAFLEPKRPPA